MLFLPFTSTLSHTGYAATTDQTLVKGAQDKICLKSDQNMTSTIPTKDAHFNLKGTGFGNANIVYAALCIPTADKTVCTTGDSGLDKEIFGADFTKDIQHMQADAGTWSQSTTSYGIRNTGDLSFQFTANKINPINGNVSTAVDMQNILGHFIYSFYGFYQLPTVLDSGAGGGDQQGTFTFGDKGSNCESILWDPYGRIFDSQSLEPIPNVKIKVLSNITPAESLAQVYGNPQTTIEDGIFNFLVDPGTYYLRLVNPPLKYSFTANPQLNANYSKAYSKRDGTTSIYKPDEAIIEKPNIAEHRDIPLDPGNNPPGHYPLINIVADGFNQLASGDFTQYGGRISHPLSKIALVGQKTNKEYARTTADKFGFWGISISNTVIPQDEPLLIKLIKVDLTTMEADEQNAIITKDVTFYPIARKIEGYVYNNKNEVVPNAPVTVNLDANNTPFYLTTADSKGFVSIASKNLPLFAYSLIEKLPGTNIVTRLTPDVFAKENLPFLKSNNLNLMTQDTTNGKAASQNRQKNQNAPLNTNNNGTENNISNSPSQTKSNNNFIALLIVLIIVVLAISGIIFIYMKKKKGNSLVDQTTEDDKK